MDIQLNRLKQAMTAQVHRNDIAGNNLANSKTTAFKRDVVFIDVLKENKYDTIQAAETSDMSQGAFNKTENPLDLAISGNGMFVVDVNGQETYTRNGHFSLDADGYLVDSRGNFVLGSGGPISLTADGMQTGNVSVSQDGQIFLDENPVDTLRVVQIENPATLERAKDNSFLAGEETRVSEILNPKIFQGNLEESNVDPVAEMVNLIELSRHFESIQRTVRSLDNAFGNAANKVGLYR